MHVIADDLRNRDTICNCICTALNIYGVERMNKNMFALDLMNDCLCACFFPFAFYTDKEYETSRQALFS